MALTRILTLKVIIFQANLSFCRSNGTREGSLERSFVAYSPIWPDSQIYKKDMKVLC